MKMEPNRPEICAFSFIRIKNLWHPFVVISHPVLSYMTGGASIPK